MRTLIYGCFITAIVMLQVNAYGDAELKAGGKVPGRPFKDLQSQVNDLQHQINNIELTPGPQGPQGETGPAGPQGIKGSQDLAGKSCPTGLAITGFDSNGNLICGAPWNTQSGGGSTTLTYSCLINYDQAATENNLSHLLGTLESNIQVNLSDTTGTFTGGSYQIDISSVVFSGDTTVKAPLMETTQAEPCDDVIDLIFTIPSVVINGTWSVIIPGVHQSGTFSYSITGANIMGSAILSSPDLSMATVGSTFDRTVNVVVPNGFSVSSNDLVVEGGSALGSFLSLFSNMLESHILDGIYSNAVKLLTTDLQILAIPAPVIIEVLSNP